VRTRCAVLLAGPAALFTALVLASSAGGYTPAPWAHSDYRWAQPTTVASSTVAAAPVAISSYPWVQPWDVQSGQAPNVGDWTQPPASVPIG
jgi:hypothetical protein